MNADAIKKALNTQLRSMSGQIWSYSFATFLFAIVGIFIFVLLWQNFTSLEKAVFEVAAGIGTFCVTTGAGGFLVNRILDLREAHTKGENWLAFYDELLGPPPSERLNEVESKILDWLE